MSRNLQVWKAIENPEACYGFGDVALSQSSLRILFRHSEIIEVSGLPPGTQVLVLNAHFLRTYLSTRPCAFPEGKCRCCSCLVQMTQGPKGLAGP